MQRIQSILGFGTHSPLAFQLEHTFMTRIGIYSSFLTPVGLMFLTRSRQSMISLRTSEQNGLSAAIHTNGSHRLSRRTTPTRSRRQRTSAGMDTHTRLSSRRTIPRTRPFRFAGRTGGLSIQRISASSTCCGKLLTGTSWECPREPLRTGLSRLLATPSMTDSLRIICSHIFRTLLARLQRIGLRLKSSRTGGSHSKQATPTTTKSGSSTRTTSDSYSTKLNSYWKMSTQRTSS